MDRTVSEVKRTALYRAADKRRCFRICKSSFSHDAVHFIQCVSRRAKWRGKSNVASARYIRDFGSADNNWAYSKAG